MVVGAEASVAVVAVGHKVKAEPVFVADNGGWNITAREPETETETESETFIRLQKSPAAVFFLSRSLSSFLPRESAKCKKEL